ncbi:arrestin domain-containing protein 17 isoform X2 [Linepithema humile]|uniref:arrestin domain-containing protein 17 isoform X2 n=1 Tax=Linepithema humile TaxID=83485 RepID=UPI0006237F53|nr:PREDICTED: arrestin domain-containing protein 3 isoform X2 [Linepithema humile]
MGLKDFRVVFDNPVNTYYSGQTVTGNIIVVVDSTKKVRGIKVRIKGEANTSWSYGGSMMEENYLLKKNESYYVEDILTGYEEYFEENYYLIGSASGSEIEIQSGEHKFPFTYTLPLNLPCSFESDFGHVRYTVKATLDRPWKFDHEVKRPFTVITPLDLNKEPRATESIQEEMSDTLFCLYCCDTSPLTVNFSLPVRGYVSGQSMPIRINVENLSNVAVNTIKLALCKIVTFHANPQIGHSRFASDARVYKKEEFVISEISKGPVEARGTADYEQHLDIPPLPPSNCLDNCSIIDIEYKLKVKAYSRGWYNWNVVAKTLIFVGTVPLATYHAPTAPPAETEGDSPTKPPAAGFVIPSTNMTLPLPEATLPSFEKSLNNARYLREFEESDYVYGLNNYFAPRYPVYNFATTQ